MLRGAYFAGCAIDITRTTAAHAFSYAFTSAHRIPHGHAVWLTLPDVALYNAAVTDADCQDPRGAAFVRERIARIARRVAGDASPAALAAFLRALAAGLGIELDPFRLGVVDQAELRRLFSEANPERMANNPRAIRLDDW
jgi:alcohol dehydrogenase class IV